MYILDDSLTIYYPKYYHNVSFQRFEDKDFGEAGGGGGRREQIRPYRNI